MDANDFKLGVYANDSGEVCFVKKISQNMTTKAITVNLKMSDSYELSSMTFEDFNEDFRYVGDSYEGMVASYFRDMKLREMGVI